MDYTNQAKKLLDILRVEHTDAAINGIANTFSSIEEGVNERWEEFIMQKTNEHLSFYNHKCKYCEAPIQIMRARHSILIKS